MKLSDLLTTLAGIYDAVATDAVQTWPVTDPPTAGPAQFDGALPYTVAVRQVDDSGAAYRSIPVFIIAKGSPDQEQAWFSQDAPPQVWMGPDRLRVIAGGAVAQQVAVDAAVAASAGAAALAAAGQAVRGGKVVNVVSNNAVPAAT